jgi:tetratricopeptide (TPR) repeat protein
MPLTTNLRGRLVGGGEGSFDHYLVELESIATHTIMSRLEVKSDGEFGANYVPCGDYVARVVTFHGDQVAQAFLTLAREGMPVEVRLPGRPALKPTGQSVSIRELRNPPSRKALDASMAAQRFSEAGKYERAVAELEKAVSLSPDFALAHSNLGVQYLRMHRFAEAEAQIQRAIEIAGPNPLDLSNLALVQYALKRYPQAMESARAVLKTKRDAAPAHYVLGLALLREPQTRSEGLAHLEEAAPRIEAARRILESIGH